MDLLRTDCLVIGSGLAGGAYALHAARHGFRSLVLSAGDSPRQANSDWAQGGIIYDRDGDSASLTADIDAASDHAAHPAAVEWLVRHGPRAVETLLFEELGVPFDRDAATGDLHFTREGGHARARIVHLKDVTGHGILAALHRRLAALPEVRLLPRHVAIDLLTLSHNSSDYRDRYAPLTVIGCYALDAATGTVKAILAKKTILATGGLGQLYLHTTNQPGMVGHGIAMAYRVGARVIDLEYIQFHPTMFRARGGPGFLVSEALRGEGAVLVDARGRRFLEGKHPLGSLAPRDIVARAIHAVLAETGDPSVFLDLSARPPEFWRERFPTIAARCLEAGVDLARQPIPVVPAAHYLCGGIWTDLQGRTSVRHLGAIGETAATGLHGANRLASTSLLECIVAAEQCAAADAAELRTGDFHLPAVKPWVSPARPADSVLISQDLQLIRQTMWNYVGLVRSPRRLQRARKILLQLREEIGQFYEGCRLTPELVELRNAVQTALLVVHAATLNPASRGVHHVVPDDG